jgi:lysozyme
MTNPPSDAALDLIKRFEGCRLVPYRDAVGIWTIGYGATYGLDRKRVTADHPPLTDQQAEELLARDTLRFAAAVDRLVKVPVAINQRGALASFAFNLGAGALQSSTLLKRINSMEWDDVPHQFGRWVSAGGRRLPGLVRRRRAEAELWAGGLSQQVQYRQLDLRQRVSAARARKSAPYSADCRAV